MELSLFAGRRRSVRLGLSLLLATSLACALVGAQGAGVAQAHAAPIAPEVYDALAASATGEATFIVYFGDRAGLADAYGIQDWAARGQAVYDRLQAAAKVSQAGLLERLARQAVPGRITRIRPFWIANIVIVHGDRRAAEAIAWLPGVIEIRPELKIEPLDAQCQEGDGSLNAPDAITPMVASTWGVEKIGADQVWAAYGVTGQGVTIGIVDTGVQWDHSVLKDRYRGWNGSTVDHNYNWYNPARLCDDTATGTCDSGGHGTHVTGIAAGGHHWLYGDIGVAPGAKWIHALGCCPDNETTFSALQWMLAPTDLNGNNPDPARRPQVVNGSWGGPGGSKIFNDAIAALRAAGTVPVFSAGNEGSGCGTLGSPGDNLPAFNVGSTTSSDAIAGSSSRGPNPFSGEPEPELTAPGESILSSLPGGGYGGMSGTSMAAPNVAGAIALLLSAEPDLVGQVDQVEELLRGTAVRLTSVQTCGGVAGSATPNSTFGWGRIDVKAAVDMAWHAGTLTGKVIDATTEAPIAGALVSAARGGHTITQRTTETGAYSFVIGSGSYDVTVEAFGYAGAAAAAVSVSQDAATTQDFALTALGTGSISGVVLEDGDPGRPITDAMVELLPTSDNIAATTTADGGYTLTDVPLGTHTLRMTARGYQTLTEDVVVSGAATQDFAPAPAPDYAVGAGGDTCSVAYDWIDATDGVARNLGDDAYVKVTLPASFTFYGNTYTDVYVGSNGFLSFGQGYNTWHGVVPFEGPPNNVIYGLGEDLNPAGGAQGTIYTKDLGDGRFVVEYHAVQHWSSGNPETFEIILDSNDGTITMQYHTVSWPDYANVGIENVDGSRGIEYSYANDPPITAGLAVKYPPFSGTPPVCQGPAVPALSATRDDTALVLSWTHLDPNESYTLWRGTGPYFDPDQGEGEQIWAGPATAGTMSRPDTTCIGDVNLNCFYAVQGSVVGAASGPSNRVGEFDFSLVAGAGAF